MTNVSEPWRTRTIVVAYAFGGVSVIRWFTDFDPMALLVAAGTVYYLGLRLIALSQTTRACPSKSCVPTVAPPSTK